MGCLVSIRRGRRNERSASEGEDTGSSTISVDRGAATGAEAVTSDSLTAGEDLRKYCLEELIFYQNAHKEILCKNH